MKHTRIHVLSLSLLLSTSVMHAAAPQLPLPADFMRGNRLLTAAAGATSAVAALSAGSAAISSYRQGNRVDLLETLVISHGQQLAALTTSLGTFQTTLNALQAGLDSLRAHQEAQQTARPTEHKCIPDPRVLSALQHIAAHDRHLYQLKGRICDLEKATGKRFSRRSASVGEQATLRMPTPLFAHIESPMAFSSRPPSPDAGYIDPCDPVTSSALSFSSSSSSSSSSSPSLTHTPRLSESANTSLRDKRKQATLRGPIIRPASPAPTGTGRELSPSPSSSSAPSLAITGRPTSPEPGNRSTSPVPAPRTSPPPRSVSPVPAPRSTSPMVPHSVVRFGVHPVDLAAAAAAASGVHSRRQSIFAPPTPAGTPVLRPSRSLDSLSSLRGMDATLSQPAPAPAPSPVAHSATSASATAK